MKGGRTVFGDPLATVGGVGVADPVEEVLDDAVAHAVAHQHHRRLVALPHVLNLPLQLAVVPIAHLQVMRWQTPIVLFGSTRCGMRIRCHAWNAEGT